MSIGFNKESSSLWRGGCQNACYIGRKSALGNPFVIGEHGDREEVIARYGEWIHYQLDRADPLIITALRGLQADTPLVCHCHPAPCHGSKVMDAWARLNAQGLPARSRSYAYAGIGSRTTPVEQQRRMRLTAERLAIRGYTLRSGAALGADTAFESGAGERKEIYLPFKGFHGHPSPRHEPSREAKRIAQAVHPAWQRLSSTAQLLQARNSHQILGENLMSPVDFVVAYTEDGAETEAQRSVKTGGTGQAIALADRWGIPCFNLARQDALQRLKVWLETNVENG